MKFGAIPGLDSQFIGFLASTRKLCQIFGNLPNATGSAISANLISRIKHPGITSIE